MKRLFVVRHAKSSWTDPNLSDFDRPLNDRGLNAAPFMGELIAKKNFIPDIIVSSPAKRAVKTALLLKEASGVNADIIYDERVYEASPQTLRQVVSEIDNTCRSAMLVGHNPGIEGFIRYLTGQLEPMPTAAMAIIALQIDNWNTITSEKGKLEIVIRPKDEMRSVGKE
jgi:phosphohistidine phosphatase